MKKLLLPAIIATLYFGVAGAAHAHGDVKCDVPKSEWKQQMELQSKLVGEGWRVRKVQVDKGCFEVYGFDDKGARVEAWFNPKTFERVMPSAK
jgi:hypothetical protein